MSILGEKYIVNDKHYHFLWLSLNCRYFQVRGI